jgi:hypothetical protein
MNIRFIPIAAEDAGRLRAGGADSYGVPSERMTSDGDGVPCRRCMRMVGQGEPYLVLAWRPFSTLQPYAETGPVFLHAEECQPARENGELPEMLESPDYIVRGYDAGERIVYGTGGVVARERIKERAGELLADPNIAFVHIRSARNNCFQCKVERA